MPKQPQKHQPEIRLNLDGSVDEIVMSGPSMVHLEQMSDQHWWMGIFYGPNQEHRWDVDFHIGGDLTLPDGEPTITVNIQKDV